MASHLAVGIFSVIWAAVSSFGKSTWGLFDRSSETIFTVRRLEKLDYSSFQRKGPGER